MPRGGKRVGAGRKKGHVTERTKRMRGAAGRAIAEGVTAARHHVGQRTFLA
jgi:hypothetical protein